MATVPVKCHCGARVTLAEQLMMCRECGVHSCKRHRPGHADVCVKRADAVAKKRHLLKPMMDVPRDTKGLDKL